MVPLVLDPPGGKKSPNFILLGPRLSSLPPHFLALSHPHHSLGHPQKAATVRRSRKLAGSTSPEPPRKTCHNPGFSRRGSAPSLEEFFVGRKLLESLTQTASLGVHGKGQS